MLDRQFLLNKDGSYPNGIAPSRVEQLGLIAVIPTDPPVVVEKDHKIEERDPELVDGVYYQKWVTLPLTEEEIAIRDAGIKIEEVPEESN